MTVTRAPLWLVAPTRYARLSRRGARIALASLAGFLLLCLTALITPGPPKALPETTVAAANENRSDVLLYEGIIDALRHGADYYTAAADGLRRGPYPLKPFFTFRLPTLAVIESILPPAVPAIILFLLAAGTLFAWWRRLAGVLTRLAVRVVAILLLVGGLSSFIRPDLAAFHEVWAGPLIALSLAIRRDENPTATIAVGLIAMLIRETAALYCGLMLVFALVERRRVEALGWGVAITVFAAVVAAHAWAVSGVVRDLDAASPGWSGMLGFGFFVKVMALATAVSAIPSLFGVLLVGLALFGWTAWRDPLATRVVATLAGYAALLSLFARTDTYYWGLLAAPLVLLGLVFVPDALRDLLATARARRFTVTRTMR